MTSIISAKDIDRLKWDALVEQYDGPGQFFHYSWYLDAICPNWTAVVQNDYEVIFPMVSSSKFGLSFFTQPLFSREFNIIGANPTFEYKKECYDHLMRHRLVFFGSSTDFNLTNLKSSNRNYQRIELGKKYDVLYGNYSQNIKRTLKKSIEFKLEIRNYFDPVTLIELFRNEKGAEFRHLGQKEYDFIQQLMINGNKVKYDYQINAYAEGELVASSFYFVSKDAILFLKGAVTEKGKLMGAMVCLHDYVLQVFCETHRYFDFGGSNMKGLREFNMKFGAIDMNYLLLSSNRMPWPFKSLFDKKYKHNA